MFSRLFVTDSGTSLVFKLHGFIPIKPIIFHPKWYEGIFFAFIVEKAFFITWNLIRTPVNFSDALRHWSRQGRALFGGINWSFDPSSPVFMGGVENPYYPLALPIWQATTATINRGWNDIIARSFGPIFFFALIAIIWQSVWQLTRKRSLSCASALVAACLPLNAWHAVSGYADIAIEVFAVASITMLLQKRLLPAGLLAAATGWIKNDGLFIYMPAILIMAIVFLYTPSELIRINIFQKHKIKKICFFLAGYTTLVPWYVFKLTHRPSVPASEQGTALNWSETITSFSDKFAWHPSAPALLIKYVLLGPTHYIFWPFVFCTSIIALPSLLRNTEGRALLAVFIACMVAMGFIFCCSFAFLYLQSQTTIHRSLLQCYGIATVLSFYAINFFLDP